MPESSLDKWPVEIKIFKVTESIQNEELNTYLVTGMMNMDQYNSLLERFPIQSKIEIGKDKVVIASLITHKQLIDAYELYTRLAKEWRGAYYSLTNKFVKACEVHFPNG